MKQIYSNPTVSAEVMYLCSDILNDSGAITNLDYNPIDRYDEEEF